MMAVAYLDDALHLPTDCDVITEGPVRLLIEHPSIPLGTQSVRAIFSKIHGVTVFNNFEVAEKIPEPCATCGKRG